MITTFGVLVVEDDPLTVRMLSQCVARHRSFTVSGSAMTARQAVAMAGQARPDLVLLDFGLPESQTAGFDVCQLLHRLEKVPDVIAVTGARDMASVVRAQQFGVFDYVVKPFSSQTIDAKLTGYADVRQRRLAARDRVDQPAVDSWFRRPRCVLPKGMDAGTKDSVVAVLEDAGRPLRAAEVAVLAGVDRVTANRYLVWLCDQGVAVRFAEHGPPGRPAYLYTLAPAWRAVRRSGGGGG